jgi:hypothetical protein
MHEAAKLNIFQGLSLKQENLVSLPFFYDAPFGKSSNQTEDGRADEVW